MENSDRNNLYEDAQKRVHKIKKFYTHLLVYIIVNSMIIIANYTSSKNGGSIFQFKYFSTAFFWGIGLAAHALSVFSLDLFFGRDWEERKIREIMDKERENNHYV